MNKSGNSAGWLASLRSLLIAGSIVAPLASQASEVSTGYQYDMRGHVVRKDNGECIRTAKWSPTVAISECDPQIVADRRDTVPVREEKALVTGVTAAISLMVLQAGEAFAFDSDVLSKAGKEQLATALGMHRDDYISRVVVDGYTDLIGDDAYNLKLSERRAVAVKSELIALDFPRERIVISAHGSANPLVSCPSMAGASLIRCLAPNRRTEVRFVVPKVVTAATAEFVSRRRSDEIREKDVAAEMVVVNTPIISRGVNDAVKIIGEGCSKEISTFCGDVKMGGNRILNCLSSHEQQLSEGCDAAIVSGKSAIGEALGDANFYGAKCGPDMKLLCSDVVPGEGRTLACLIEHNTNITMRCYSALVELNLIHE